MTAKIATLAPPTLEAHHEVMSDLPELRKLMKEHKAKAFGIAFVHLDGTITTMWHHPEGANCSHQLNSAVTALSFRINQWIYENG